MSNAQVLGIFVSICRLRSNQKTCIQGRDDLRCAKGRIERDEYSPQLEDPVYKGQLVTHIV